VAIMPRSSVPEQLEEAVLGLAEKSGVCTCALSKISK